MSTDQGAFVVAHYNTTDANLRSYKDSLDDERASRLFIVQAELTSESAVKSLFERLVTTEKNNIPPILSIIVNHAIWPPESVPLARMSLEQWNKTLSTNLTSSFLVIRQFLQALEYAMNNGLVRKEDDRISVVLIGSTAGKYGEPSHGDYAASKSGELASFCLTSHPFTERSIQL